MKKSIRILLASLAAVLLLYGCWQIVGGIDMFFNINKYGTGNKIDHTDKKAPKVIMSTEIEYFRTYFCAYNPPFEYDSHNYDFEIAKNEDGSFTLKESKKYNLECDITKEEILGVQEIIKKYDLVRLNGKDCYTSGLAPEYAPVVIKADYASRESLYIREDGNPNNPVFADFLKYFLKIFEEKGFTEVLPAPERTTYNRFDLQYRCEGKTFEYVGVLKGDAGKKQLWREIWYSRTNEMLADDQIDIPEDYYVHIGQLIKEHDLMSYVNFRTEPFGFKGQCDYVFICIENIEGEQFNLFYSTEDTECLLTPELASAAKAIATEIDKYFE